MRNLCFTVRIVDFANKMKSKLLGYGAKKSGFEELHNEAR